MIGKIQRSTWLLGWFLLAAPVTSLKAQQPTNQYEAKDLVGTWQLQQLAFDARRPLPDSLIERLFHDPAGTINQELKLGRLVQQLTFRADGTYLLTIKQANQGSASEQGTYWLKGNTLHARTAAGETAAFSGEVLARLKRQVLVLEFPFWKPEDQVFEQERYQRIKE